MFDFLEITLALWAMRNFFLTAASLCRTFWLGRRDLANVDGLRRELRVLMRHQGQTFHRFSRNPLTPGILRLPSSLAELGIRTTSPQLWEEAARIFQQRRNQLLVSGDIAWERKIRREDNYANQHLIGRSGDYYLYNGMWLRTTCTDHSRGFTFAWNLELEMPATGTPLFCRGCLNEQHPDAEICFICNISLDTGIHAGGDDSDWDEN